jgi:hypothetical protein
LKVSTILTLSRWTDLGILVLVMGAIVAGIQTGYAAAGLAGVLVTLAGLALVLWYPTRLSDVQRVGVALVLFGGLIFLATGFAANPPSLGVITSEVPIVGVVISLRSSTPVVAEVMGWVYGVLALDYAAQGYPYVLLWLAGAVVLTAARIVPRRGGRRRIPRADPTRPRRRGGAP